MEKENNNEYKITLNKIWIHLKTILIHKHYVFYYARKCGIPWRGFIHDMSKFSPIEFWTNVRYVKPGISPIEVQKKEVGFSKAWLHHKGHNPHHYEYWMDRFDNGCYVTRMPYKYSVECVCDYLAANKAYNGKDATYTGQYEWWKKQIHIRQMHPDNKIFIEKIFSRLAGAEKDGLPDTGILNKQSMEAAYYTIMYTTKYPMQVKILDEENDIYGRVY